MRFSHKIKKLAEPNMWRGAWRITRRAFLARRFIYRLDPDEIMRTIDLDAFRQIQQRHGVPDPGENPEKYLDLRQWLTTNLRRVRDLDLDFGARKRVLDIGCGAGYFVYICRWLGHDVVGMDIDESPMFRDLTRLLNVQRVIWRIERYLPLPDLGAPFDLIVAHMICFNDHKTDHVWGPNEWEFFFTDARRHLTSNGRIYLELNREFDGTCYTPELRDYFVRRGAIVDAHRVSITAKNLGPVEAEPAFR
ncbi:MAG TPA: class I SAM-dependent methyltransferase [Chthoniobacterales bacterium]